MGWDSAIKERPTSRATKTTSGFVVPTFETEVVDWDRLVVLDFETFYSDDYTLKKLSTSEYVRDPRFKAQMVGIKIGRGPTKTYPAARIRAALSSIVWRTHTLLCHHSQFDGFILSEHYGIQPLKHYDTLSMARALHSQDISASLDDVSVYYGGGGKIKGALEDTKGVLNWSPALVKATSAYCINDVEETLRIFKKMLPKMPADEIDIIDMTVRMFTQPVLKVDLPRVQKEMEREIAEKKRLLLEVASTTMTEEVKLTKAEAAACLDEEELSIRKAKKIIGSSKQFAQLLVDAGVAPPRKLSAAYMKLSPAERATYTKDHWGYAFAQTDLAFQELLEDDDPVVRSLCEARVSVKSSTNITRAQRFLDTGTKTLPAYYKYAAALTLRFGGGDKKNLQNLTRGGELRKSIIAPPGHQIVVADSGQIEARTNAWFWGQDDLIENFRRSDRKEGRDVYSIFADLIYKRQISKDKDPDERFVGKVCVLALGYQMGAERLRKTLALGTMGPKVFLDMSMCNHIVHVYRMKNKKIVDGWNKCQSIIEDMAAGRKGSWKCISWEKECIWLPNGMKLRYPGLHDKSIPARVAHAMHKDDPDFPDPGPNSEWVYLRKGQESKIYGGLLCENIIQALARIIVVKQLLNINRKSRIVMTTHDEGATVCKTPKAPSVLAMMLDEMSKPLEWCRDIPLNAEGGFNSYYSK